MIRRFEQFSFAISSIYRSIQKIERDEMIKYGLKGPYAQYLVAMDRYPEGITAAQLCEICDKDKAAVSRALGEMESKGLITKESANDSGYRALVRLTPEGKQAGAYVAQKAKIAVSAAGMGLTDEKRAIFYEALYRIAGNLQSISENGLPEHWEHIQIDEGEPVDEC